MPKGAFNIHLMILILNSNLIEIILTSIKKNDQIVDEL